MFILPPFRSPDQVAPTLVGWTLEVAMSAPPLVLLLLLVTDMGWSRLLPVTAAMGGSILSEKQKQKQ